MAIEILGFAIGDIVGIVALGVGIAGLLVAAITFYIGHTRGKKSEQLHISREIWDAMYAQQDSISILLKEDDPDYIKKIVLAINRLRDQLGYFVYLTEKGEINDPVVREYYRKQLRHTNGLAILMFANDKLNDFDGPQDILNLIRKYHVLTCEMEAYVKEFEQT
jgi:hypothetical protein